MYQMRLPDLVRAGSGVVCRIWYEMTTCQLCRRKTVMLRKQPHEAFGASTASQNSATIRSQSLCHASREARLSSVGRDGGHEKHSGPEPRLTVSFPNPVPHSIENLGLPLSKFVQHCLVARYECGKPSLLR